MRRPKKRPWLWLLAVVPVAVIGLWWALECRLQPIVESYSENKAVLLATEAVNETVSTQLAREELVRDLVRLNRDEEGRVVLLETDTGRVNALRTQVTRQVLERLRREDTQAMSIPLGTLSGIDLLSGRGPQVPVQVNMSCAVTTHVAGEWTSAGINQTAHTLRLEVTVDMVLAISGHRQVDAGLKTDYVVSETILVGQVPDSYGGWYTKSEAVA